MNIAVFASGRGSNFTALAAAARKGRLKARIALLVCDVPRAGVLARARAAGIPAVVIDPKRCAGRADFERKIIGQLKRHAIGLIALAGFMRMLSPAFVRQYKNRILNIHPALLPAFKGKDAIGDAFAYGVKVTGVTVHFVDELMDHGPVILQQPVAVSPKDTRASLEVKIHRLEHRLYPQAVRLIVDKKVRVRGRKVVSARPFSG